MGGAVLAGVSIGTHALVRVYPRLAAAAILFIQSEKKTKNSENMRAKVWLADIIKRELNDVKIQRERNKHVN